jgi:hypothetical protein
MKMILNIFSLILLSTSLFSQNVEEKSMIVEINKLRSNPSSYIKVIEDFKKMKTSTTISGFTVTRKSNTDWVKECDETINFLKTAKPVDTLTFDNVMYNKLTNYKFVGEHTSLNTNGSENFVISNSGVTYAMALLLIDAGYTVKGHRINLMDPKAKKVAVKKFVYNNNTFFVQDFTY